MTQTTADSRRTRAERKAALLATLEQQRVDILVNSDRLLRSTTPLEQHWKSAKLPVYAAGGFMAYRLIRHPSGALAAGRKALAGYVLLLKLKRLVKGAS